MVFLMLLQNAAGQPLTVDPESIVPLPGKFDMEMPAPDAKPNIQGPKFAMPLFGGPLIPLAQAAN